MLSRSLLFDALWLSSGTVNSLLSARRVWRPARPVFCPHAIAGDGGTGASPLYNLSGPSRPLSSPATPKNEYLEAAKLLTRSITASTSAEQVLTTLDRHRPIVSVRHLTTALCRLCRLFQEQARDPQNGDTFDILSLSTYPTFRWLIDELVQREDEWPGISIVNVLEACYILNLQSTFPQLLNRADRELLRSDNSYTFKDGVSIMVSMVKLGYKMTTHAWLRKVETTLLSACSNEESTTTINSTLSGIPHEFSQDRHREFWALAWTLTEMECSTQVADAVFLRYAGRGMLEMQPKEVVHFTRLAAERGSKKIALRAGRTMADALNNPQWQRKLASPRGFKERSQSSRELAMLFLNIAKLIRKSEAEDGDSEVDSKTVVNRKVERSYADTERAYKPIQKAINFLLKSIYPLIRTFNTVQVVSVITALSYLQSSRSALVPALANRAVELCPSMDNSGMGMIARALASLQYDSEEFIEAAATTLHSRLQQTTATNNVSHGLSFASLVALLYSFAVANRCNGPAVQRVLPDLVVRLVSDLTAVEASVYDPREGLAHLIPLVGWSLMVAKGPPGHLTPSTGPILQALRVWRRAITAIGPYVPVAELSMVQHVEVALRIECPNLGADAPAQYDAFLNSLYDSGRLSLRASAEWDAQTEFVVEVGSGKHGSKFQWDVYKSACNVVPGWKFEYWERDLCYPVDAALPDYKIALEADGPTHYAVNTMRQLGHTTLKGRLLSQLGWTVVNVPYFDWEKCKGAEERKAYLLGKLEAAGVAVDELMVENDKVMAQKDCEEDTSIPNTTIKVAMSESTAEEGQFDGQNAIGADEKDGPASATQDEKTVAQRAQQLDLIKVRQGKMSRSSMAMKAAMRNAAQGENKK